MKKKRSDTKRKQTVASDDSGAMVLFLMLFVIVVLNLAGAISQSIYAWGFNFWSLVNLPLTLGLLVAALALGYPSVADAVGKTAAGLLRQAINLFRKFPPAVNYIIVSLILVFIFYLLRSRALIYGDGYLVLEYHTGLDNPFDLSVNFMKPLVVIFHRTAFRLLSAVVDTAPENILAMINAAAGVTACWALYRIVRLLGRDGDERRVMLLGTLTCGAVILFFGYIENYTWPLALGLWTLAYSLGYLRGVNGAAPALVLGIVAVGFHAFCMPFLVAAILAVWMGREEKLDDAKGRYLGYFNGLVAVFTLALVLAFQLTDLPPYFVKLWPVEGQPYWFLSAQHLVDVANEMILAAPAGVILAVYFLLRKGEAKKTTAAAERLLGSLALMTFMITFWVDPKLGAARDWDLLSFVGLPLTLWALYGFRRRFPAAVKRPAATVIFVIVILIVVAPNLAEKNDSGKAVDRLDKILYEDMHYQLSYLNGERCDSWGFLLEKKLNESYRAQKYFQRRIKTEEGARSLNFALGRMHFRQKNLDSAYYYLKLTANIDSANPELMANLATVCNLLNKTNEAVAYARKTMRLDNENTANLTQAGIVLSKRGYNVEALQCFHRVLDLAPDAYKNSVNLGLFFDHLKEYDSAYYYFRQSLTLSPDTLNENPQFLFKMATVETELEMYEPALGHARRAQELMPDNEDIVALLERINQADKTE